MASSNSGGEKKDAGALTSDTKSTDILDKYNLDKNPIKYAQYDGTLTETAHDKEYLELTLRSGKHSELVQKLLRQRIEQRAKEFPRWPGSLEGGVRALWVESRFWYDRERMLPDFDDDWRKYRSRYLHSLELHPSEPVHVPEYERSLLNPIRRFYMKIGDFIEYKILRKFYKHPLHSATARITVTRGIMAYFSFIGICYYLRYNSATWDKTAGVVISTSAPIMYPDHPMYPFKNHRTEPAHFADYGFTRRGIYKDLNDYEDNTMLL